MTSQHVFMYSAILLALVLPQLEADLNLPIQSLEDWSQGFGLAIYDMCSEAMALREFRHDYVILNTKVLPINGTQMLADMKRNMEDMLSKKVHAVGKLVKVAEEAFANHKYDKDIKIEYPKAKDLNTTEFPLEENEHFNYIEVNLNMSTVHVPTNVYDESAEVLNGVAWSQALDEVFVENYQNDSTLTWQYFGSAEGFFRNYPGMNWSTTELKKFGLDMYDCRTRGWYIQAATSPKDVVILMDSSGSMTGLRMEIAKATVKKIIDTLSDDDFFNVMNFSSKVRYIDDCFNGTLIQANADNKKRIKEALTVLKTEDIANFEDALREAFELFKAMNESGKGAQCNKAIMIITDGAPDYYTDIFKEYNRSGLNVRVFTFLIGREVSDSKQVISMACANRGYFSHISTLADVHEHVQDYIHVLSRPMVIDRKLHTIWTTVYVDAAGLRLMTSVAQPVFDIRNTTKNKGNLLGVMGTDVPLKELTKLTPKYKLGVNGYAFAITNNGYILFHPDFRPTKGEEVKPNYNSVDLAEVELPVNPSDIDYLRKNMVDRKTGNVEMIVKVHFDDMRRVAIRKNHYFYTDIEQTPFSLGITLPDGHGLYYVDGTMELSEFEILALSESITIPMPWAEIRVAEWNYCEMDTNETLQNPVKMITQYIMYGMNGDARYELCDNELIESLLYDLTVTTPSISNWMKAEKRDEDNSRRRDKVSNINSTQHTRVLERNGIELLFIGTKAGVTRFYKTQENLTDPTFIDKHLNTIEELYYTRAVDQGEDILTFSVPFKSEIKMGPNSTMLTASTPIVIDETNGITGEQRLAVAAVVGLQMKYNNLYDLFVEKTSGSADYDFSCSSDELDCYVLDNNGFVILAENFQHVGKFFGEVEPTLMKELTGDHKETDDNNKFPYTSKRGVFRKVDIYDYQGLCEIWRRGSSGASSFLSNPLQPFKSLVSSVGWLVQEIALFFIQFSFFNWFNTVEGANNKATDEFIQEKLGYLSTFASHEQVKDWKDELLMDSGRYDYRKKSDVQAWFDHIRLAYGPRLIGREACIELVSPVQVLYSELPHYGGEHGCSDCERSYSIHQVPNTNLMLLAFDALCECSRDGEKPISIQPEELQYNDTMMCQRLQQDIYRRGPSECFAYHTKEDSSDCGQGHMLKPSFIVLMVLQIVFYVILTDSELG